jgi:methyl-accepting chemotaxis protein
MRIATKLILGATLLALVPLLTSNLLVGNTAIDTSHKALEHASEERLKGIRDTTKARLTDYLDNLKNLMHTLSANPTIAQAAMNLSEAFRDHAAQTGGLAKTDEYRNNVQHFFSTTFQNQYNTLNANANAPVDQWVSQMSDKALEFQSLFIANNPNPLGS